jgi:sporulation-control protein
VHWALPFYQEIQFFPAPQYATGVNAVELTFVTNPNTVEVVLEFDKRGGMFEGGHDSYGRCSVAHADADTIDLGAVGRRLDAPSTGAPSEHARIRRPRRLRAPGLYGQGAYGHAHGQPRAWRAPRERRPGMGGLLMGAAGGLAAGYLAGEIVEEVFDDGGDEGGED